MRSVGAKLCRGWASASASGQPVLEGQFGKVKPLHELTAVQRRRRATVGALLRRMTQRHYLDSVRDEQCLDAQFKSLLRRHWMEEAQHAKLDTLIVEALAEGRSARQIMEATEGYLAIGGLFDGGLKAQVDLDLDALMQATGRHLEPLTTAEREVFREVQHQANRWTFIGSGMTHPRFLQTLGGICPDARDLVEGVAFTFC